VAPDIASTGRHSPGRTSKNRERIVDFAGVDWIVELAMRPQVEMIESQTRIAQDNFSTQKSKLVF
jgi:hypothetical protein